MTARLRGISGKKCISILCKDFGFSCIRQKGSHVFIRHHDGRSTVVPLHDELKIGTLKSILDLAKVRMEDFERKI